MDSERVFLTAEWRHLALLNYEVDQGLSPMAAIGRGRFATEVAAMTAGCWLAAGLALWAALSVVAG